MGFRITCIILIFFSSLFNPLIHLASSDSGRNSTPLLSGFWIYESDGTVFDEQNRTMWANQDYTFVIEGTENDGIDDIQYIEIDLMALDLVIRYTHENTTMWSDSEWIWGLESTLLTENLSSHDFRLQFIITLGEDIPIDSSVRNPQIKIKDMDPNNPPSALTESGGKYKQYWTYGIDEYRPEANVTIIDEATNDNINFRNTKQVQGKDWNVYEVQLAETGDLTVSFNASESFDLDAIDGNGILTYEWTVSFDYPYESEPSLDGHTFTIPAAASSEFSYRFQNVTVDFMNYTPNANSQSYHYKIRMELVVYDNANKNSDKFLMFFIVVPEYLNPTIDLNMRPANDSRLDILLYDEVEIWGSVTDESGNGLDSVYVSLQIDGVAFAGFNTENNGYFFYHSNSFPIGEHSLVAEVPAQGVILSNTSASLLFTVLASFNETIQDFENLELYFACNSTSIPTPADIDGDGILNGDDDDTDGDGLSDDWELANGLNPWNIGVVSGGKISIYTAPGEDRTGVFHCRLYNPTEHRQTISILVTASGLAVAAPGSVHVSSLNSTEFEVALRAGTRQLGSYEIRISATVTHVNGITNPTPITRGGSMMAELNANDTDGDGVTDDLDAFPEDANETTDSDGDGIGDNADEFPDDPLEDTDTDGDGVGDNSDHAPENPNIQLPESTKSGSTTTAIYVLAGTIGLLAVALLIGMRRKGGGPVHNVPVHHEDSLWDA